MAWRPTPFGEQADAELQASAALWRLNELLKEFVFCALFGVRLWSGYSCQSADFQRRDPSSEYSIHIPGAHTELIELAGKLQTPIVHDLLGPAIHLLVGRVSTESTSRIVVQFDVARASCACLHGRDARATLSSCTTTRRRWRFSGCEAMRSHPCRIWSSIWALTVRAFTTLSAISTRFFCSRSTALSSEPGLTVRLYLKYLDVKIKQSGT